MQPIKIDDDLVASARPLAAPRRVRNPVTLALFWLSKTDPQLVSLCSRWAMATQAAFGVFVAFTAALAFGSAYYTLSTLNTPSWIVPVIATGWSILILFLDREIAGSLDKASALVRPLLALFIGTLVAIPIELWVFQQRVDQELQRQYRQDNKQQLDELRAAQVRFEKRRDAMVNALAQLRKDEADWGTVLDSEAVGRLGTGRTGVAGAGPAFQNAQTQQVSVRQRISEVRRDLEQLDKSMPEERQRMEGQFQREEVSTTRDFVTRYEALTKVIHSSKPLYWLSWLITLALILVEMTPALLKLLTPHVDYHHLVRAEMRENIARIDEISDRNYRLAIENPEAPELSVSEKFAITRLTNQSPLSIHQPKRSTAHNRGEAAETKKVRQPPVVPKREFDQLYLDELCDSLLHLFGNTPRPVVSIQPANVFEKANAHCRYPRTPNEPCLIEFNEDYLRSASEQAVHNTMKHELIHAWMHFMRINDSDPHGPVFVMKGREVGCDVARFEPPPVAGQKRATGTARKVVSLHDG